MRTCTRCNAELTADALFCRACGEQVAQAPPALTEADVQASREAVRVLTERAHELRPEAIQALVSTAQAPLQGQITELTTALEGERSRVTALEQDLLAARRVPIADPNAAGSLERRAGFTDFGEFIDAVAAHRMDHSIDPRLQPLIQQRQLSMTVGAGGGFLVPPEFAAMLAAIPPQALLVRPRARVFPASGTSPDASITMPFLNQGAAGVFSGVHFHWVGEGAVKPATQPSFGEATLTPHELSGTLPITDKLLRNAPGVADILMVLFREAIAAAEDDAFLHGNGVARPLGVVNGPALLPVARAGAGAIAYADVVNMFTALMQRKVVELAAGPIWIASRTVLPQLMTMVVPGAGNNVLVWQTDARSAPVPILFGFPIMFDDGAPILGAANDLMLCDFGYYLIKDGFGPSVQSDQGMTNFATNQTVFKVFLNVDGQPWVNAPLLLADGVTNVSPFVGLL